MIREYTVRFEGEWRVYRDGVVVCATTDEQIARRIAAALSTAPTPVRYEFSDEERKMFQKRPDAT